MPEDSGSIQADYGLAGQSSRSTVQVFHN